MADGTILVHFLNFIVFLTGKIMADDKSLEPSNFISFASDQFQLLRGVLISIEKYDFLPQFPRLFGRIQLQFLRGFLSLPNVFYLLQFKELFFTMEVKKKK